MSRSTTNIQNKLCEPKFYLTKNMSRSRTGGFCGSVWQTALQRGRPFVFPAAVYVCWLFKSSPVFGIASDFCFSYSDKHIVISQNAFNLYFPTDEQCCHVCLVTCLLILCPFLYSLICCLTVRGEFFFVSSRCSTFVRCMIFT